MTDSISPRRGVCWWPAAVIGIGTAVAIAVIRSDSSKTFQQHNLNTLTALAIALGALLLWWILASRVPWKTRGIGVGYLILFVGMVAGLFRIRGVSGDLVPILEPRWKRWLTPSARTPSGAISGASHPAENPADAFPQYLGANRDGVLPAPRRAWATNWAAKPPELVWRHAAGAAWSGFVIADGLAWTQEQAGLDETVTCYQLATGSLVWQHRDEARYQTTIAGEGPRATPTLAGGRILTLGATGLLNCLDRTTGKPLWQKNLVTEVPAGVPGWGFASSPLVHRGLVIVIAGGGTGKSVVAYDLETGGLKWSAGDHGASYSSPSIATLAGIPHLLAFNSSHLTAHHPESGAVLWDHPFGNSQPHVAMPVLVGTNRVLISAGYGMGSELLEVTRPNEGAPKVSSIWLSKRLKAKFANPFVRDGFAYGLDDGMLACMDLRDGSQAWKEGRFGHGQGLVVGDLYLLMAESGELVLMRPDPKGPGVVGRFPVFSGKTWNPIAVVGELALVRNDQEAALVRLPVQPTR